MPRKTGQNGIKQYIHSDHKRRNNPPVGLVTSQTDQLNGKKTYQFDPHLDPQLQWAGKTEGVSFSVGTVSLHVHGRIDPLTIIEAVRKREPLRQQSLFHYFETKENNLPIREAIEFYRHSHGWSNRLVGGDSSLIMNSLLEKEGMAGKVQMVYIDPPYGIKYSSNFQPFVNKRKVTDGKDEDLTQEPEMIKAFRDTWELGIHSYLTYLRNRLLLAKELLHESGSCFVQISDKNLHHVREIMDDVFGSKNFITIIPFRTATSQPSNHIGQVYDFLCWYAKDASRLKYYQLYKERGFRQKTKTFDWIQEKNGTIRRLSKEEKTNPSLLPDGDLIKLADIGSKNEEQLRNLRKEKRIFNLHGKDYGIRYERDFPVIAFINTWNDTVTSTFASNKVYVVQTNTKVVERCLLMTTDPGDLVLDPTCGSGTTVYVAEKWGRRWVTCDTSRVAITLAKQRLMTAIFDYYELAYPEEGISSGFNYEKVPHITLGAIANQEPPKEEILYDCPIVDKSKKRVTGPFTIEAVPSLRARSFAEIEKSAQEADISIARSGETVKQNEWIDELLSTGIRGKGGQILEFARIEPIGGTRWIHAEAETKNGIKAVVSFGPKYAPLEQRQVELAIEEAQELVPKPKLVIFASFQFDPEAAKDIDALKWPGVDVLKVQMNTDLLTSDLKKKRASNESFWLVGQPDVEIKKKGSKYVVTVNGFDYYNTRTGEIESGDASKIAMWELDTDYDGRSIYPRQVFFPLSGKKEGWSKLAKNLKAQIDEELIKKYSGNISVPFKLGNNSQIAVKIIDDRGLESIKIIRVKK